MSAPAVLIASAKLRPGEDQAFAAWQARHNIVIDKFPGFISSDVIPPSQPENNEWTIILHFRSQDELTAWQRSPACRRGHPVVRGREPRRGCAATGPVSRPARTSPK